jgi:hypothetical protein
LAHAEIRIRADHSKADDWFATSLKEKQRHPNFLAFESWLNEAGYGSYLNFRSIMGADYDAEMWFDDELGQYWRR